MIIKFSKKEKKFKKEKINFYSNMNFYWRFAVIFLFLVIILVSFLGYSLFMKVNKEYILPLASIDKQVEKVKKEQVEKVLDYFSTKEQKSTEILNSPAPVIDPSL